MAEPQVTDIYNFLPIDEQLGTAGQPVPEQFPAIKAAGYDVVINLGMADSPRAIDGEAELVAAQGLDYIAIPVVWDEPESTDLDQFFEVMRANEDRKRFVHCIANMRVSAFTFLYRVIVQDVPVAEARRTMQKIWDPNPIWQDFIEEQLEKHNIDWDADE